MSEEYSAPKHIATWNGIAGVWETPESLLCAHSALYSETFPTWGFMRGGALFPLPPPELHTDGNASSSLLPTPVVNDMGAKKTPEEWDEWTAAMRDRHGNGNGHGPSLAVEAQRHDGFGPYQAAVELWERVQGRAAPAPAVAGRLNPVFVEWLMGLREGWVTHPDLGLTHGQQLKALGNGVVPQQALLALRLLGDPV
jgi:hypothetical protein